MGQDLPVSWLREGSGRLSTEGQNVAAACLHTEKFASATNGIPVCQALPWQSHLHRAGTIRRTSGAQLPCCRWGGAPYIRSSRPACRCSGLVPGHVGPQPPLIPLSRRQAPSWAECGSHMRRTSRTCSSSRSTSTSLGWVTWSCLGPSSGEAGLGGVCPPDLNWACHSVAEQESHACREPLPSTHSRQRPGWAAQQLVHEEEPVTGERRKGMGFLVGGRRR